MRIFNRVHTLAAIGAIHGLTHYDMVSMAMGEMATMRAKFRDHTEYFPQNRIKGRAYAWYDKGSKAFKWSKNPRMDYSEQGLIFVAEFFNGYKTDLQHFHNNVILRPNRDDLSQCIMQVLY